MEKLNKNAVALAVGITTTLVYLVCMIFVAIFPLQTVIAVGNYFVHGIDISSIASKNITLAKSIMGLILVFLSSTVAGYVFAFIYNFFSDKI